MAENDKWNPGFEEPGQGEEIPVEFPEDKPEDAEPENEGNASENDGQANADEQDIEAASSEVSENESSGKESQEEARGQEEEEDGKASTIEISDEEVCQEEESEEASEESEETSEEATSEEASEEALSEEEGKGSTAKGEKMSFFGRKKKEKEKYEQQITDLTDRLRRTMAEFDNFRKRTEKEKSSMYIIGARDIVERLLPVVDSFERGLSQIPEDGSEDAFAEGMRMIYKQLMKALEDAGVKPIEAVGQTFDPNLHNAVMHVDDEEAGENIVVEEFQKGYTYKDFVVRHSMVKVAN